jgi:hypothetical protein
MLPVGWLNFSSGTVEIEFLSGARLLVVGPAKLRLESESSVFLENGKASAYVPQPARGFTVKTPTMQLVDLGTAFGVDVTSDSKAEVHVFDGEISIQPTNQGVQRLEADQAVKLNGSDVQPILAMPEQFPNGEELAHRTDAAGRARLATWRQATERLRKDPALVVGYSFDQEQEWGRSVKNHLPGASADSNGALVGAGWVTGRWPGKQAIEFRSLGDRLRFQVPGAFPELTVMAWMRVDSLPNDYNALLMPSRYQKGALHWSLERGGELRLTMRNHSAKMMEAGGWDGPVSGAAVSNMDFGRWLFLATTYAAESGQVVHYVDGRPVGTGTFEHRLPAILGAMEFGNWGADDTLAENRWIRQQQPNLRLRNFVGRLDELNIFSRVLAPAEILSVFQSGQP